MSHALTVTREGGLFRALVWLTNSKKSLPKLQPAISRWYYLVRAAYAMVYWAQHAVAGEQQLRRGVAGVLGRRRVLAGAAAAEPAGQRSDGRLPRHMVVVLSFSRHARRRQLRWPVRIHFATSAGYYLCLTAWQSCRLKLGPSPPPCIFLVGADTTLVMAACAQATQVACRPTLIGGNLSRKFYPDKIACRRAAC